MKATVFSVVTVVALIAMAAAPNVLAQSDDASRKSSTVTFFGHVFSHGADNPMPANTQFPNGADNYGLGEFDWCVDGVIWLDLAADNKPAPDCSTDDYHNKVILYSTAGFVDVRSGSEFTGGGGFSQLHNERGMTKDAILDTSKEVTASIVLSHDFHAWSVDPAGETYCPYIPNPRDTGCPYPYWGWDPGVVPDFVVRASLYYAIMGEYGSAASEAPPVWDAVTSGNAVLVAQGESTPEQVTNGLPGYPNFHRFDVGLGNPAVGEIPKEANFFLVYEFFSRTSGTEWSTQTWRVWGGEFFPPYFTLPVKNAFDVELVIPQFIYDKLIFLGIMNTPWGSYDINSKATTLTIEDAKGKEIEPVSIEAFADYSVAHGAHYKPVNLTYVWDYKADKLAPGTYTVTIAGQNHQGSSAASCTGTFTVAADGGPGPVQIGECGQKSASEEFVADVSGGAANQAGEEGVEERSDRGFLGTGITLHSSQATFVAPAGASPVGLVLVTLIGVAGFLHRRWIR